MTIELIMNIGFAKSYFEAAWNSIESERFGQGC